MNHENTKKTSGKPPYHRANSQDSLDELSMDDYWKELENIHETRDSNHEEQEVIVVQEPDGNETLSLLVKFRMHTLGCLLHLVHQCNQWELASASAVLPTQDHVQMIAFKIFPIRYCSTVIGCMQTIVNFPLPPPPKGKNAWGVVCCFGGNTPPMIALSHKICSFCSASEFCVYVCVLTLTANMLPSLNKQSHSFSPSPSIVDAMYKT